MEGLTPGRTVHYVLPNGVHRPAVVVCVRENGVVDLQVFTGGPADYALDSTFTLPEVGNGLAFRNHIGFDATATIDRTWHWIEKA